MTKTKIALGLALAFAAAVAFAAPNGPGYGGGYGGSYGNCAAASTAECGGPGGGHGPGGGGGYGPGRGRMMGEGYGIGGAGALMTAVERDAHRAQMQSFTSLEQCSAYWSEHRNEMARRARERGLEIGPGPRVGPCERMAARGLLQ